MAAVKGKTLRFSKLMFIKFVEFIQNKEQTVIVVKSHLRTISMN